MEALKGFRLTEQISRYNPGEKTKVTIKGVSWEEQRYLNMRWIHKQPARNIYLAALNH